MSSADSTDGAATASVTDPPADSSAARLVATPGQTIGPFFHFGLPYDGGPDLVPAGHAGAIRLTGRVLDGAGNPIPDALIELWQAAPDGSVPQVEGSLHRDGWTFTGWGRCPTDRTGRYTFTTLEPGIAAGATARFFALVVFARGQLNRLFTRCYLPAEGLDTEAFLSTVDADRRDTLIATADDAGYVFDIRLQGDDETVFLRFPGHDD